MKAEIFVGLVTVSPALSVHTGPVTYFAGLTANNSAEPLVPNAGNKVSFKVLRCKALSFFHGVSLSTCHGFLHLLCPIILHKEKLKI